jgi:hypothetical protein
MLNPTGGLDMRQQEHFVRAQRLWQPMLAEDLREVFLLGKWGERVRARLPKDVMLNTMRASHITVRRKETKGEGMPSIIYSSALTRLGQIPCSSGNRRECSCPLQQL